MRQMSLKEEAARLGKRAKEAARRLAQVQADEFVIFGDGQIRL